MPCIKDATKEAFLLKLVPSFVSIKEYGSIFKQVRKKKNLKSFSKQKSKQK